MYNHRGLEQFQACEDLSLLFNDETLLKCEHIVFTRDIERNDEMGILLTPLADIRSSCKTTNKREKNKLD